ncbi:MAG: VOC family protein [Acidobacteria bacterium]|nr:VOC family protein [Acidobacteriota bacterium]
MTQTTTETQPATTVLAQRAINIDHVAIAVRDLEESIHFYSEKLGFTLEERRETRGKKTAMISAVMRCGPLTFVLLQGTSPESQVTRYVETYGPGVQHIAIGMTDLPATTDELERNGLAFDTGLIHGNGLIQRFSHREAGCGMMFEFIEHTRADGNFSDESVQQLFEQLEEKDSY